MMTQVGIYGEIQPEPSRNPQGSALRISLELRLWFTIYPFSRHNTDTVYGTWQMGSWHIGSWHMGLWPMAHGFMSDQPKSLFQSRAIFTDMSLLYLQWEGNLDWSTISLLLLLFIHLFSYIPIYLSGNILTLTSPKGWTLVRGFLQVTIRCTATTTLLYKTNVFCVFLLVPLLPWKQFSKPRPSGPMLSISRNFRLSVCLSVHVFIFEVPFKLFFAPTSQGWMSKIFRDVQSLGKSKAKKWSLI